MLKKNTKYKVLLADDEPQNLKYLFEALSDENYYIYTAPNGAIAVEQSMKYMPDAIIMDWEMPETNGIEAIKQLRKEEKTKNIPIIMATGKMTSTENLKTALKAGANDYIRKPFDTIEIIARVNSMIIHSIEHKKNIELQQQIAKQQITHLEEELERNTSELSIAKLRLIKKGEYITELLTDLQNLKKHTTDKGIEIINKIISQCKMNESGVNWKEFELLFEKVHQSFFSQLQLIYPELTLNEKRLCALIKLNLTTKEISAISNKSIDAIKKGKSRLKTKLKLEDIESLYRIIQDIN
jgi:DNA-binding response OmpR family regulator/DNA-binding CsgD family transcriptional regulator